MSKMLTTTEFIRDHQKAVSLAMKKATRTKKTATAFLVRAGILEKGGKRLAKAYR